MGNNNNNNNNNDRVTVTLKSGDAEIRVENSYSTETAVKAAKELLEAVKSAERFDMQLRLQRISELD